MHRTTHQQMNGGGEGKPGDPSHLRGKGETGEREVKTMKRWFVLRGGEKKSGVRGKEKKKQIYRKEAGKLQFNLASYLQIKGGTPFLGPI